MNIGERIKYRRELLKMSQEELAHKVGYKSRSSINKIEIDGRGLPQSKVVAIANALDTTPAYLMGWEEEVLSEGIQRYSDMIYDDIKNKEFLDLYNSLDDVGQKMVIESMRLIKKVHPRVEEPVLNAAHERTDIKVTEAMRKHDEYIMDDDNF